MRERTVKTAPGCGLWAAKSASYIPNSSEHPTPQPSAPIKACASHPRFPDLPRRTVSVVSPLDNAMFIHGEINHSVRTDASDKYLLQARQFVRVSDSPSRLCQHRTLGA